MVSSSPRSRGWDLDPPDQALARFACPQRERCASGGGRRFRVASVGRRPPPAVTGLVRPRKWPPRLLTLWGIPASQ